MITIFEKGGIVMWPLVLLSLTAVTFIIERGIFFIRQKQGRKLRNTHRILALVEKGQLDKAESLARGYNRDYVARILFNGLVHRNYSITRALETQAVIELQKMKKYLTVLDTVITAAPLLGILGTVIGIIASFDVLGAQRVDNPMAVTRGISEALITTAFGLIIDLFTLIPYNIFQSQYRQAIEDVESVCSVLEVIMDKLPDDVKLRSIVNED